MLIINADDWGWSHDSTDRSLDCFRRSRISTISAMVFMEDSERAADLARENGIPVGLHLNLTQKFSSGALSSTLSRHHCRVVRYLKTRKVNQILFNPFLCKAFDYVFQAQWEEFIRLFETEPTRLDGHHHMHLCMNMIASGRLPRGIKIRRNFTFGPGEKDPLNRLYRYMVDRWLKSRFQCTDFFFSIEPIDPIRLQRLVLMSKSSDVEIMVHPGVETQYRYLLSVEWKSLIAKSSVLPH